MVAVFWVALIWLAVFWDRATFMPLLRRGFGGFGDHLDGVAGTLLEADGAAGAAVEIEAVAQARSRA